MKPMGLFVQDAAHGALPTLYAATQDLPDGSYVGPDGRIGTKHWPKLMTLSPAATDPEVARGLWDLSARLTHTNFAAPASVEAGKQ